MSASETSAGVALLASLTLWAAPVDAQEAPTERPEATDAKAESVHEVTTAVPTPAGAPDTIEDVGSVRPDNPEAKGAATNEEPDQSTASEPGAEADDGAKKEPDDKAEPKPEPEPKAKADDGATEESDTKAKPAGSSVEKTEASPS